MCSETGRSSAEILFGECSLYSNYLVQSSFLFVVGTAFPHIFFSTTPLILIKLKSSHFRKCCEENLICDRLRKSCSTVESPRWRHRMKFHENCPPPKWRAGCAPVWAHIPKLNTVFCTIQTVAVHHNLQILLTETVLRKKYQNEQKNLT